MMTRRGFACAVLAGCAALALGGCEPSGEDRADLRYRLIVEVEAPDGIHQGSSVIEVVAVRNPDWVNPEGRGIRMRFKGEAVAVDLSGGKVLFALLQTDGGATEASYYPWLAFEKRLSSSKDLVDGYRRLARQINISAAMPPTEVLLPNGGTRVSALPMLVTFKDIADPTSVERVDPDNLAASFGNGYRLKAISVEITDAPVTTRIEKRLGWLAAVGRERSTLIPTPPKYLDEVTDSVQQVTLGYFKTEIYK